MQWYIQQWTILYFCTVDSDPCRKEREPQGKTLVREIVIFILNCNSCADSPPTLMLCIHFLSALATPLRFQSVSTLQVLLYRRPLPSSFSHLATEANSSSIKIIVQSFLKSGAHKGYLQSFAIISQVLLFPGWKRPTKGFFSSVMIESRSQFSRCLLLRHVSYIFFLAKQ